MNVRDAIANAFQERWPDIKITDIVDSQYGDPQTLGVSNDRINVELPSDYGPDISIRVATIDLKGEEIEATFYGGGKYSHNLFHPASITDLEELLADHIESVGLKVEDICKSPKPSKTQ